MRIGGAATMSGGWNYAAALERVGGDESLLVELIAIFFEEYPKFASRLTQSLSQKDFGALREAAHSLKGSLGYLGAASGEAMALAVEQASLARDAARAGDLVAQLMAYIEALRQLMQPSAAQSNNESGLD
ncbi:MAG TPA: Hpt domain-containing protein [Terriglobales bacterium]|nr:Hpt domain-containing protein [Terriglobales bacterium]